MKKDFFLGLFLFFLIINYTDAIEILTSKNEYYPEETLQAEITGNFVSLSPDNFFIYEDGIPRAVPVVSGLTRKDDVYYFYAILPKKSGNFSIRIENAEYISSGELKKDRIIKNFTIIEPNQTYLSFDPGFVITTDNFSIKIKSPYKNQKILAVLEATNDSRSLNLIESEEKVIDYSIPLIGSNRTNLKIGSYSIPVFVLEKVNSKKRGLIFFPEKLEGTLAGGESYLFQISVENTGNEDIKNIKLSNNLNLVLKPELIDLLKKGERKIINASILVSTKTKNNLSGEINLSYGDFSQNIKVFFKIVENKTEVNLNRTTANRGLSCKSIGGKVCVYPERCSKETTESLDGPCCLGECHVQKPAKDYGWVFGVGVLIVLALIFFLVIIKTIKKQKTKVSEEILMEKAKRFDERMNPNKEVNGKLERV